MSRRFPWSVLGVGEDADARAIRKAYADAIKAMDLDADVDGYARLRQARDHALRLAKSRTEAGSELPAGDLADPEFPGEQRQIPAVKAKPPRWEHAAPDLPGEWTAEASLSTKELQVEADAAFDAIFLHVPADRGTGETIPLPWQDGLTPPMLQGYGPMEAAIGLTPGQTPFERLGELLHPQGAEEQPAPFNEAEEAAAIRAMKAVIDEVRSTNVSQQDRIELWLAEELARAWPRSAPLLEQATAAFHWEREWGRFDARPVIEYLGSRLRGYRFQQNVLQPGHRFHKAWLELVRPGKAGPLRWMRAGSGDVQALLSGIRKHFPELEDHFDPQRVTSWETPSGFSTGTIVLVGIVVLLVIFALTAPDKNAAPPPAYVPDPLATAAGGPTEFASPAAQPETESVSKAVEAAVTEAFGDDKDANWLWKTEAELAQTVTSNARYSMQHGEGPAGAENKAIEIVRERTYRNGRTLDGALFDSTMRIRLGQLIAARKSSTTDCEQLMRSGWLPASIPVPESLREQERTLAVELAMNGHLKPPPAMPAQRASVPGEIVTKVMSATGLGEQQVASAMKGDGNDPNRCAVAIALLETTLGWSGPERHAILLTL